MKKFANIKVLLSFTALLAFLIPQGVFARDNTGVADFVNWAFSDLPEMITIAQCESGIRQYSSVDVPLKGSGRYVGIFQIDEQIHAAKARTLGYDIYTSEGNAGYARYMYGISGTTPWKGCVKTPVSNATANTSTIKASITPAQSVDVEKTGALTMNLNLGVNSPQVLLLQKILNKSGFLIAKTGPGSISNETSLFGPMTREAVRKFQCAKMNLCGGSESTNGYGRVGPATRTILNQMYK